MNNLTAFISYSHDSQDHKNWVLKLANRLITDGVQVILDQHDMKLGGDLPSYMEKGLSTKNRVVCVCSDRYVEKANDGRGGVGYEKMIMTGELLKNIETRWIIPIVRNNATSALPTFLASKLYEDFNADGEYERHYESLLRELIDLPLHPRPALGTSPFIQLKETGRIIFQPKAQKFHSPGYFGKVSFDYSSNDGCYSIGDGEMLFELKFTKASDTSIHVLNDSPSIDCLALANGPNDIVEIIDAYSFDFTSRHRSPRINEIILWQNKNGYFAATKIIAIKDRPRNSDRDEVTIEYKILTNATWDFSK